MLCVRGLPGAHRAPCSRWQRPEDRGGPQKSPPGVGGSQCSMEVRTQAQGEDEVKPGTVWVSCGDRSEVLILPKNQEIRETVISKN